MKHRLLLAILLSLPLLAGAAEQSCQHGPGEDPCQMVAGSSCMVAWDYPEGVDILASFAIWTRPEAGTYPTLPTKVIPSMEHLVTQVQCDSVRWGPPGVYAAVIKAMGLTGEVSGFDNELLVRWGEPSSPLPASPPHPPDPPKSPPSYLPPTPPPLTLPPALALPTPTPPPTGQNPWLSSTCQWQGNCAH